MNNYGIEVGDEVSWTASQGIHAKWYEVLYVTDEYFSIRNPIAEDARSTYLFSEGPLRYWDTESFTLKKKVRVQSGFSKFIKAKEL